MKVLKVSPEYIKQIIAEEREIILEHDRYARMIISEGYRLKAEGYTVERIDEQLMDIIKKLGGGFIDSFKNRFARWLIKKMGMNELGWFARLIANVFERVHIMDFKKYFRPGGCDELTNVIMDAIGETGVEPIVDGMVQGMGINPEGTMYTTAREAITNSIAEGDLAKMIKDSIGEWICSIDVSGIVDVFKSGLGGTPGVGAGTAAATPPVV